MDGKKRGCIGNVQSEEDREMDLIRGPWTVEEDFKLINYIAIHGEGRWNSLARSAGNFLYICNKLIQTFVLSVMFSSSCLFFFF